MYGPRSVGPFIRGRLELLRGMGPSSEGGFFAAVRRMGERELPAGLQCYSYVTKTEKAFTKRKSMIIVETAKEERRQKAKAGEPPRSSYGTG